MFLLVPAYQVCPGSKAVKRSSLLLLLFYFTTGHFHTCVFCSETYSPPWASSKPGVLITVTICVETNCQSNSLEPLDSWHRLAGDSCSERHHPSIFHSLQHTVTSLAIDFYASHRTRMKANKTTFIQTFLSK